MSFAATASTSAAAATRFSARAADVSNGGCKRCTAAAAARVPASSASTRRTGGVRNHPSALVVRCNNNQGEWPAPAVPPARNLGSERRDMLTRYHEISNIDPNDPKALDVIGSKTPCKVQFNVPYQTAMGEEVLIIGSHEKLARHFFTPFFTHSAL